MIVVLCILISVLPVCSTLESLVTSGRHVIKIYWSSFSCNEISHFCTGTTFFTSDKLHGNVQTLNGLDIVSYWLLQCGPLRGNHIKNKKKTFKDKCLVFIFMRSYQS